MTKDCLLTYKFSTWKFQAQNIGRTCCGHKLFWMSKQKQKTICVHNMFSPSSELGIFMYWTCNLMNNLSSYCGLVHATIRASEKDLPVLAYFFTKKIETISWSCWDWKIQTSLIKKWFIPFYFFRLCMNVCSWMCVNRILLYVTMNIDSVILLPYMLLFAKMLISNVWSLYLQQQISSLSCLLQHIVYGIRFL